MLTQKSGSQFELLIPGNLGGIAMATQSKISPEELEQFYEMIKYLYLLVKLFLKLMMMLYFFQRLLVLRS